MTSDVPALLDQARALAKTGQDAAAQEAYLAVLRQEPTHFSALTELAALALANGHRSAARTAYEQAVRFHPANPLGRTNLGTTLWRAGEFDAARAQYEAALASDPNFAEAHQGLARVLTELGLPEAAAPHWEKGFAGHALVTQPYRGTGEGLAVLMLVSAKGGNIPTHLLLDSKTFAVSTLYAEYYDPAHPLPPHGVVLNAIGDADLCGEGLACAQAILRHSQAPVINPPAAVRDTGRAAIARRFAGVPGLRTPSIQTWPRAALADAALSFPVLLRAPGFHTGHHFLRVEAREHLADAIAALPGEEILAIEYLDARGPDGMARKYRVMIVDGALYPLHLALSRDWKVHYFTANMRDSAAYRAEEQRFLEDMPGVLGARAMAALTALAKGLALDYAGVDFALTADGSVLLFEANATMVVFPPDDNPMWDYRRAPIDRVLDAARRMIANRATGCRARPDARLTEP